jgi:transportin-1
MPEQEERIRTIAGYLLKNNARLILNASPEVAQYVKASVLQAFTDASIMIRNAAGQDIVAFLGALEPKNWPECLQQLVTLLDSPDLDRQEVSHFSHYIIGTVWKGGLGVSQHGVTAARKFEDEAGLIGLET